jgi:hypothetical protein
LIAPDNDRFPFRTIYTPEDKPNYADVNIGMVNVVTACPSWKTYPDIVASKLDTGKCPRILRTIDLVAVGRQSNLRSFKIFGDDAYTIDLTKSGEDFFARIIELRIKVQDELENCEDEVQRPRLSAMEQALKLLAKSSAYGILVEIVTDDHKKRVGTTIWCGTESHRKQARAVLIGPDGKDKISSYKVERPGKYFSPFGALIPAGAGCFWQLRKCWQNSTS